MRWILLSTLLIAPVAAQPASAADYEQAIDRSILWRSEGAYAHALPPEFLRNWQRDLIYGYDVDHIDLELAVDMSASTIDGAGTLTVTITEEGVTALPVDLHEALAVDRVTVDGIDRPYSRTADQVNITLAAAPEVGAQLEIMIEYSGTPEEVGNKSMKFTTWYGRPVMYTLSTPYSSAGGTVIPISHYWRPCKDVPDDKSTFSLTATVPDEMLACSNGLMTSNVDNGNGTRTVIWEHDVQVAPYLITVGAAEYDTLEEEYVGPEGTADIQHFVYPERYTQAVESFNITVPAMEFLASIFGEYPFIGEKYGMFSIQGATAVEEQTMTAYPANLIDGQHNYDWILVHELAHQWWGDCVTVADWAHVWLAEGFASYTEALWWEHLYGAAGLVGYMNDMDAGPYAGTIVDPPYIWNAIVYDKGAWILHMLRNILGEEAFFAFVLDYRATHEFGNVVTEDLIAVAENHFRADLDWFFGPWLYHEGRPAYEYSSTVHGTGPYTVNLLVTQVQSEAYPTYTMPIDVSLNTAGGELTYVIWDSLRVQAFQFVTDDAPTNVHLDPDHWVLADFTGVPASAPPPSVTPPAPVVSRPNPFAERTSVSFALTRPGTVALRVFDVDGRMVRTLTRGHHGAGEHRLDWDGRDDRGQRLPAGRYFIQLVGPEGIQRRAAVLLR